MTPLGDGPGSESAGGGPAAELSILDDESLLGELRIAAARYDPPPALAPSFLEGLLTWRDPDAELAALVADSRELAGAVRGAQDEVLLRFEAPPFAITFEASVDASGQYRVIGHVQPGGPGDVEVLQGDPGPRERELLVRCDEWGRFEAYPVAPGPISLRLTPEAGPPVHTAWVVL
jgi:hypothetical protein